MNSQYETESADAWVIPLHGIETPGVVPLTPPVSESAAVAEFFYSDDELPTIEFRPRLRRSA